MLTYSFVFRSFGAVFKAKHIESGELVAIKRVILEDNEEIQKEIEILKNCSSPHIIKYYGHFQKDADIFVRQFVPSYLLTMIRLLWSFAL
jgi:serine/threonine protein kinase